MSESTAVPDSPPSSASSEDRRSLLDRLGTVALLAGLASAYGTLGAMFGRYLFPSGPPAKGWMFVSRADRIRPGASLLFQTPAGAKVNVARQGDGAAAEDYVALSSTCPHLGCQVHWEPQNDRFFCPCHNGVFTPDGTGVSGPPGDAGQSLPRYPLKVDAGLLYMEVDVDQLAMGPGQIIEPYDGPVGPGHDPCLQGGTPCGCAGAAREETA